MSMIWIYSILNTHKSIDEWPYSFALVFLVLLAILIRLKLIEGYTAWTEPLVTLIVALISFTLQSRAPQSEPRIAKPKNKKVKKGSCQQEERPTKQQIKMHKKKKRQADIEKHLVGRTRGFQKECTKYYAVLGTYTKLNMPDTAVYENLLPFTMDNRDLICNNYPSDLPRSFYWPKLLPPDQVDRRCIRCSQNFQIKQNDEYVSETRKCLYHPKKSQGKPRKYLCCNEGLDNEGCQSSDHHVTNIIKHPRPLVKTRNKKHMKGSERFGVYGLDCEMSYTTNGLEVTKVCVVGVNGLPIYNTFVKPEHEILDYNTIFSGVTATDLKDSSVTLSDVQAFLLKLFNEDSIIIGHGLNSDFLALGLIHSKVIDTSVIYHRKYNPTQKPSLKELAKDYLQITIQNNPTGHDSVEDARTSLELALLKIANVTTSHSTQVPFTPTCISLNAEANLIEYEIPFNKYNPSKRDENKENEILYNRLLPNFPLFADENVHSTIHEFIWH